MWGYFFPIFRAGPISGPISFPILGRRPKTYFLAGRLGRNPSLSVESSAHGWSGPLSLGACIRGRATTHASKSQILKSVLQKVLRRFLRRGALRGS